MTGETEHSFNCPYCGEEISMILDLSINEQQYIEDCEVCCNPIEIHYKFSNGIIEFFEARGIDQ
ncbi:CPXCG motif-containing cysteine-rich protein [Marinigracilibium pacificum]|uniref:CPXCG motif-containing cysteine-rich protein n=1 Tax=Marinigracilibium pacificum TaxID=2729599 RepID=A0A848IYV5_9BACT|nr:CPXCG motif-containing cysteine-rich protein [Marinigracilibium pacificum]NMM47470.1 CPXCG motif-containing cysteine-rich protein [Marinigracilibium pacificum]